MSTSNISSSAAIDGVLKTFNERVDWAVDHKKLCVFHDHNEIIPEWPLPRTYAESANREFISSVQGCYEKAYNEAKEEAERKKVREEKLKQLDAIFEQYPDLAEEFDPSSDVQNPSPEPASDDLNLESAGNFQLPPVLENASGQKLTFGFAQCKRCKEGHRYHERDPVQTPCREDPVARHRACSNPSVEVTDKEEIVNDRVNLHQSCDTALASAIANLTAEVVKMRQTQEKIAEGIWLVAEKANTSTTDSPTEGSSIASRVSLWRRNQMPNEDQSNERIRQDFRRGNSVFHDNEPMEELMDHLLKPIAYRRAKRKVSMIDSDQAGEDKVAGTNLLDSDTPIANRRVKRKATMNYRNVLDAYKRELLGTRSKE